jgi:hypothetical protein
VPDATRPVPQLAQAVPATLPRAAFPAPVQATPARLSPPLASAVPKADAVPMGQIVPIAAPVVALPAAPAEPPPGLSFDSSSDVVVAPALHYKGKRRSPWFNLVLGVVTILLITGAVAVCYFLLLYAMQRDKNQLEENEARQKQQDDKRKQEEKSKLDLEQAFYFKATPDGFTPDFQLREPFTFRENERKNEVAPPVVCLSRKKPEGWLVATARDYRTRLPTDGEMVEAAVQKLRKYLNEESFQWERLPEGGRLAGLPAIVFAFVGENPNHIPVEGEVYLTAAQGYAFMVFTWAPEANSAQARKNWAAQREGFNIGEQRANWKEAPIRKERVPLPGFDLELALAERVWRKQDNPEDIPPGPKLLLQFLGGDPAEEQKGQPKPTAGKNAWLYLYSLPKADSVEAAYQVAENFIKTQREGTDDAKVKVDFLVRKDRGGSPLKGPATLGPGNVPAYVVRMDIAEDEEVKSYAVVAVVRDPGGQYLALVFDVLLPAQVPGRREFWDTEITAVLNSLAQKKK